MNEQNDNKTSVEILQDLLVDFQNFQLLGSRVARMILAQTTVMTVMLCLFGLRDALDIAPNIFERAIIGAALINIVSFSFLFIITNLEYFKKKR